MAYALPRKPCVNIAGIVHTFKENTWMLGIYKAGLLITVSLTLIYALQGFYPDFIGIFSNAFPPIIAGAAVVVSGLSLERYWRKAKGQFSIIGSISRAGCSSGLLEKQFGPDTR